MKRVLYLVPFALVGALVACGGDDDAADDDDDGRSSSSSSSGSLTASSSSGGASSSSSGSSGVVSSSSSSSGSSGVDPFACEDAAFVYPADTAAVIDPETYEDYLGIAAGFLFDVVGSYTTTVDLSSTAWDESGKLLAEEVDMETGAITVHRLAAPAGATGAVTDDALTFAQPSDLFDPSYANYPAVVSLPGNQYVLSYTSDPAAPGVFPGLAYLFDGSTQKSRAFSNGFFTVVGVARGDSTRLFYDAFSPFTAASQTDTNASGLYVHDHQGTDLAAGSSFALFATGTDSSGPVVKGGDGTIVVASQGASTNVRAIARCASLEASATLDVPVLHSYETTSTQSIAVLPATATEPGFVVHQAYQAFTDDPPPPDSFATAFTRDGGTFTVTGTDVEKPLGWGPDTVGLSFFGDAQGYLWVAVSTPDGGHVLKLRRRAAP